MFSRRLDESLEVAACWSECQTWVNATDGAYVSISIRPRVGFNAWSEVGAGERRWSSQRRFLNGARGYPGAGGGPQLMCCDGYLSRRTGLSDTGRGYTARFRWLRRDLETRPDASCRAPSARGPFCFTVRCCAERRPGAIRTNRVSATDRRICTAAVTVDDGLQQPSAVLSNP